MQCFAILAMLVGLAGCPGACLETWAGAQVYPGLEVVSAGAENLTASRASEFRLLIRNGTTREIDACVVAWIARCASGRVIPGPDAIVDRLGSLQKLPPDAFLTVKSSGTVITVGDADAIVAIEGKIDFVLFADGEQWGPDERGLAKIIKARREGARMIAMRMLGLYEDKGVEAILEELRNAAASGRP